MKLKADRQLPRDYSHIPWTDNDIGQTVQTGDRTQEPDTRTDGRMLPSALSPSLRGQ